MNNSNSKKRLTSLSNNFKINKQYFDNNHPSNLKSKTLKVNKTVDEHNKIRKILMSRERKNNEESNEEISNIKGPRNNILRQINLIVNKVYKSPKICLNRNRLKTNHYDSYNFFNAAYGNNKMDFILGNKNDLLFKKGNFSRYNPDNIYTSSIREIKNLDIAKNKSTKNNNLNHNKKNEGTSTFSNLSKKIKINFSDYTKNDRIIKNPQIYVLTKNNLYTPEKSKLPSIKRILNIKKKNDLNELIPDFSKYKNYNQEKDFYEYYTNYKKNKSPKFIV